MFMDMFWLVVGMILLIKGADWFVDGASRLAKAMKIPPLVIGLTLVSIGTSMPEFSVSVTASINGLNDMSFGNIIGSNIFNTFFVIGASAFFATLVVTKSLKKYDIPCLIGIYLLLMLFAFVITPNMLERWESIVIFVLTFIYTAFLLIRSKNEPQPEEDKNDKKPWYISLFFVAIGLISIVGGGTLTVDSAEMIALELGMSELLVGLTVVAIGTSLPELVTSIVAAKKGENDIAVGNALGSCIFNVILILGLSGIIRPMGVAWSSMIDMVVMLASAVIILLMAIGKKDTIDKKKGLILILIYVVYLAIIIMRDTGLF